MSRLFTVAEFAKELNFTTAAVRKWIGERRITVIRIGRSIRISNEEFERIRQEGLCPAVRSFRRVYPTAQDFTQR